MDRARRRKFGQNFLDTPTAQMIAGDLPAKANEAVLEIGPGHGALTEHLLDRAVELSSALNFCSKNSRAAATST